jgi:hypothetical protein
VLGCEGILPGDLAALAERNPGIRWYPPPGEIRTLVAGGYLDPVALICKGRDTHGHDETVICTQFKNQPMSDPTLRYEPDHLCVSVKRRFLLRNDDNSVRCAVLVCSDTLTSAIDREVWHTDLHGPWLILHLQLCSDPRNVSFRAYRAKFYNQDLKLKEYLCVNRARGYAIAGREGTARFGGSAYYTKAPEADVSAARTAENDRKGLHYTWCDDRKAHMYCFNYDEYVFWLSTTKASQKATLAPDQANGRIGPIMKACFTWDNASADWHDSPSVDDGSRQLFAESGCTVPALTGDALSTLDKERFIALSTGDIEKPSMPKDHWYDPACLRAYRTGADERLRSVVFAHDPDAAHWRHSELARVSSLSQIMARAGAALPECVRDLGTRPSIEYFPGDGQYDYNLYSVDRRARATGAFLGTATWALAREFFRQMKSALDDPLRLVVWFESGLGIRNVVHHEPPVVTASLENADSIAKEYDG